MTKRLRRRHGILVALALAACGGSSSPQDAATSAAAACASVGTAYCHQMYACYSATDIAGFGLPTTEAACVTQENSGCSGSAPSPGYCKGTSQTSTANAMACAADMTGMTCAQWTQPAPANDVCKTMLCNP